MNCLINVIIIQIAFCENAINCYARIMVLNLPNIGIIDSPGMLSVSQISKGRAQRTPNSTEAERFTIVSRSN